MLKRHAGQLVECRQVEEVSDLLLSQRPDLIFLDLSERDVAAAEATRFIRAQTDLPLIALVPEHEEQLRIAALDAGADDCAPPFGSTTMWADLLTGLERSQSSAARTSPDAFQTGLLGVDLLAREVRLRGKPVHVTPIEYKLLRVLLESAGKVVTHERLLREVWGQAAIQSVRRLRVHMKQLQRKFELAAPLALYLIAEPAGGYRLWVPA
jgi:two-component system KDP operon response regulator KdpE